METDLSVARAMALLRRQRHSFLNHLQVISGWLQLERPERARQYLDTIAAELATQTEVIRQLPAAAGIMVMELEQEAESYGVRIHWQVAEPLAADPVADWLIGSRSEVIAALAAAATLGEGERHLVVTISAHGLVVHTPTDMGKG